MLLLVNDSCRCDITFVTWFLTAGVGCEDDGACSYYNWVQLRNEEKGKAAVEKILSKNPNALATFMQLDLADKASIHKFVEDFHATEKKLHILINNAGHFLNPKDSKRQFTKDNFELTMGTNHLGPFLLTHLLLPDLKKTGAEENGDARIVVVTCVHNKALARRQQVMETLDVENFFLEKENTYNSHQAYKNSKLANAMFTYELAKQLENTGVTVNCLCPGFIPTTELFRNTSNAQKFYRKFILHGLLRFTKATRSVEQGAKAVVEMATGEKLKGVCGKYYKDNQEMKAPEESVEELQKKVYELSARYCHLEGYEPLDAPPPPPPEEPKEKSKEKTKSEGEEAKDKTTEESEKAEEKTEEKSEKDTEEEKPADSAPQESDDAPKKVAEDDDLKKEAPATEITPAATEIAAQ
ncbi:RDH12 [Acanthosepion pharaonis]|uniref:RDH12 n=1 Tax=Acanthosepion pharaonis TaxID=158019 RepID=A0A812ESZ5_ACAPH|nr:RDH12 [Sepia pharaonis]